MADAIGYRADVVAWAGNSGRWACWGERQSGICVLHILGDDRLLKELIVLSDDYVPLLAMEAALNDVASSEMTAEGREEFAHGMRGSYGTN